MFIKLKRKEEREWEEMNQNIPSGSFAEKRSKEMERVCSQEGGGMGKGRYFKKEEIIGCLNTDENGPLKRSIQ